MNIDDPKLTAYTLGEMEELTGEERRAVEALLAESTEARAFVEETAVFARTLKAEFGAELPGLQLEATERSDLLAEVEAGSKVVPIAPGRHWMWSFLGSAAAVLLIAFFVSRTLLIYRTENVGADSVAFSAQESGMAVSPFVSLERGEPELKGPAVAAENQILAVPPSASADVDSQIEAEIDATLAIASVGGGKVFKVPDLPASVPTQSHSSMPSAPSVARSVAVEEIASFTGNWGKRGDTRREAALGRGRLNLGAVNESYPHYNESAFLNVAQQPLSTFSIDVDTASYSNVRRFLMAGQRPPADAVRIEELLNYFRYDYAQPEGDEPFATHVEVAQCPWMPENRLVKIGLKGREIARERRAASNLVFLIDVSGSMSDENKLPLLKQSMRLMVERLGEDDRVAIVVYASEAGVKLPSTRGHRKAEILAALEELRASGGTNGGEGIQQAYAAAAANFIPGGINRVILATDGDFNVGTTSEADLTWLLEEKAKSGVYLTVLGFGEGNFKDLTMKALSTKGNGNYAYIDSLREGRKVLVEQLTGTLVTIAKDVKIQVEFNPAQVSAYRLIGYENRLLRKEDFNDDKKDAGEIGAGHTVTALYEVVPAGKPGAVDGLKYQPVPVLTRTTPKASALSGELLTVKLRYKKPDGETSQLIEQPVIDRGLTIKESSRDFRFAAAVAQFGMLLKQSPHAGSASWGSTKQLAFEGLGEDEGGYRTEWIELLKKAEALETRNR